MSLRDLYRLGVNADVERPPMSPLGKVLSGFLLGAGVAAVAAYLARPTVRQSPTSRTVESPRDRHDRKVAQIARAEERRGCTVAADIAGYPKPPVVYGRRADVHSVCATGERMIEVEHPWTVDTTHSRAQISAFQRWEKSWPEFFTFKLVTT
jgi:hypothetical protein